MAATIKGTQPFKNDQNTGQINFDDLKQSNAKGTQEVDVEDHNIKSSLANSL